MGLASVYKCEKCSKIIEDGWLLRGSLSKISGQLTFGSGPQEEGPLSYCRPCLAQIVDPQIKDYYNPPYERGGPGDW